MPLALVPVAYVAPILRANPFFFAECLIVLNWGQIPISISPNTLPSFSPIAPLWLDEARIWPACPA